MEENLIKKYSRKIPILKAGNMSLGINLLMYLTEIASASLGNNYLSKVFEVHHRHKKDHPSGTALMLGKGIAVGKNKDFYKLIGKKLLNKKSFPYGKKINFNSIRKGEIIGEHEVKFSSGKEIITLNHEAFDRALYSEGALTAAKWLNRKKPSPTIVTGSRMYYHPTENRFLTTREAASLQSFPANFEFMGSNTSQWTQIGNAVPPLLGEIIGKQIIKSFNSK